MKRVAFSSHVALVNSKEYDGIGNVLKTTLSSIAGEYIFVRNSIDGKLPSEVQYFNKDLIIKSDNLNVASGASPLRYVSEYFKTVKYFKDKKELIDVYIGIDPLNALSAIRLRQKGIFKKAIFYTADYSPKRFGNPVLNFIYHAIDKYCVKNADEVWSVSTRICEVRRKMELPNEKNIFIPNVPPVEYDKLKNNSHNKFNLVTTGIIDKQLDFDGVIMAVANLKDEMPELTFTIIGNGPEEERLKQLAKDEGVEDRVVFTGRLPLEEALEVQSKSGIGLALYTGVWGFNYYGDSTKCREYFNFGLPVISTDTHSTVDDIKDSGAGVVVKLDSIEYVGAIKKIISGYSQYAEASRKVGDKYSGVHNIQIKRLLSQD